MAFFDGDDMGLSNEGGRLLTRRAALAGTATGALALASMGLAGRSVAGADANDASDADDELTDEQKKVHEQIVATYNVEKQAVIKKNSTPSTRQAAMTRRSRSSKPIPLAPIP